MERSMWPVVSRETFIWARWMLPSNTIRQARRTLTPMKSPRGSVGVAALNGKIYAIGGRGVDTVTVATHEVYDPATNKWSDLAPLPKARDHLAVIAVDGRIHAIGGRFNATVDNNGMH